MGRPPTITRDLLLDTASRVFGAKGFRDATLADIAGELGVTPAALLRHVESKQELFLQAMTGGGRLPAVIADLEHLDARSDPRIVLRRIAEKFIPFAEKVVGMNIAAYMHAQTSFVVPFDTRSADSPPRRGLRIVEGYFRRAAEAGVIRIRDPRAAALLFIGSLQSYVFLHKVLNVVPLYPLGDYVDALIDLWSHGGIRGEEVRHREKRRAADRDRGGSRGHAAVPAREEQTPRARPRRNTGGADGERRVARRRP